LCYRAVLRASWQPDPDWPVFVPQVGAGKPFPRWSLVESMRGPYVTNRGSARKEPGPSDASSVIHTCG